MCCVPFGSEVRHPLIFVEDEKGDQKLVRKLLTYIQSFDPLMGDFLALGIAFTRVQSTHPFDYCMRNILMLFLEFVHEFSCNLQ